MKQLLLTLAICCCVVAQMVVPSHSVAKEESMKVAALPAPVNINVASPEELQQVKGIGKVTAERIVAFRTENGPFASVDDLVKVKGIGNKTLESIRDRLTVE